MCQLFEESNYQVRSKNSIGIQEELYNSYMPARIEGFLEGLNCNIMAYGQTGTGKTHTMFGPPGYMARAAKGRDVSQSLFSGKKALFLKSSQKMVFL